jgi:hypothetical protein
MLIIAMNTDIRRRTAGELDHGSPKSFRDVRRCRLFTHTGVGLWAMLQSDRVQFRPPPITRHRAFIRRIGCFADPHLGAMQRSRFHRG